MRKFNVVKNLSLIIFGLFILLVLLETSLRIISFFYLKAHSTEYSKNKDESFNIVCIGDSFTIGTGAAIGEDYPSQLEKILNSRSKRLKFRVINVGMGGATTSMALNLLNKIILKYRPDMFIVVMGCNDWWNYASLNLSCIRKEQIPLSVKISPLLFKLKSYKLLRIIMLNTEAKIDEVTKNVKKAIGHNLKQNRKEINRDQNVIEKYLRIGDEYYKQQHNLEEAIVYYNKVLEIDPMNAKAFCDLASIYREQGGKSGKALVLLKKVLEMNCEDPNIQQSIYLQLSSLYNHLKIYDPDIERILERNKTYANFNKLVQHPYKLDKGIRDAIFRQLNYDNSNKLNIQSNIIIIRKNLISKIILFNLDVIARISKDNKIKLIFCSYPEYVIPEVEQVSQKYGIAFIDFSTIFKSYLQLERKENYFVADGHCNGKGYRVMAEVIADRILDGVGL